MTNNEQLMYQILGKFSDIDAPFVFKGALITKLVLAEGGFTSFERPTKDIDANWIGTPPSMRHLTDIVSQALNSLDGEFTAEAIREYRDKKSAGIAIVDTKTGDRIITIDISMKPVVGSRIYHYGEAKIRGVLANEILADKISVLSKHLIFRRAKDVVDVYALAHAVKVQTQEIFDLHKANPSREVGSFDEFISRRSDVEHAYNKLAGIDGKPHFDDVYSYLSKFLQPFIQRDETPMRWNSGALSWDTPIIDAREKLSVIDEIRNAKKVQKENSTPNPRATKKKDETEL
jgi:hypothetical protein